MTYTNTPGGQFVGVVPMADEDPNIAYDLLQIADAIEKRVVGIYATSAARDSAATAMGVVEGMFAYTMDTNTLWYYSGSAWVKQAGPTITTSTSAPSGGVDGDIWYKV